MLDGLFIIIVHSTACKWSYNTEDINFDEDTLPSLSPCNNKMFNRDEQLQHHSHAPPTPFNAIKKVLKARRKIRSSAGK